MSSFSLGGQFHGLETTWLTLRSLREAMLARSDEVSGWGCHRMPMASLCLVRTSECIAIKAQLMDVLVPNPSLQDVQLSY